MDIKFAILRTFLSQKRFTYFVRKAFARWSLPSGEFRLFGPLLSSLEVVLVLLEWFGASLGVGDQKVDGWMVIKGHRSSKNTFGANILNGVFISFAFYSRSVQTLFWRLTLSTLLWRMFSFLHFVSCVWIKWHSVKYCTAAVDLVQGKPGIPLLLWVNFCVDLSQAHFSRGKGQVQF